MNLSRSVKALKIMDAKGDTIKASSLYPFL